ncbi:MAG TPA: N-acetylglucosamine-6-phosphate deacetylase [Jiangellaceae bacterium]|nr:N-acetylglucosamine-6-phosphate deacetylase [Jiangellaceae bacterium]
MATLANGRLVTPDGIVDGWLETAGGTITAVGPGEPPRPADRDMAGQWVVPGFVDIHVHGGAGADFTTGSSEQARRIVALHRRHGTTTMLASLVTADVETMAASIDALAGLVDEGELAGIHLEGPFLAPTRRGAHDAGLLRVPEPDVVDRLVSAGPTRVRMVTLAPEQPAAIDAVRRLVDFGVVVAVGHTDATYDQTRAAIDAGAAVGTHLFNAMRPVLHREPGPVPALLEDDRVTVELICDGVHLHPATIRWVLRTASARRVALVTDAMAAAGAGDGDYLLGHLTVRVRDGVARQPDGTIAGSTLTMDRAFRCVVDAGASVEEAVTMASTTPAEALGLADEIGSITVGRAADLVVLDRTLHVAAVMVKGSWVEGCPP